MIPILLVLVLSSPSARAGLLAEAVANAQAAAAQAAPRPVALAALAANPAGWAGKRVIVVGTLENVGTNFFTDRRIVLKDSSGVFVDAAMPAPISVAPGPIGSPPPSFPALSDFLGERIEFTGEVIEMDIRGVGKVWGVWSRQEPRVCKQPAPGC